VTLVGDAIHSMTPYRGIGGNVALRDASALCKTLVQALIDKGSIEEAVHRYKENMRDYGFAAVRRSLDAMRQAVTDKGLRLRFATLAFRVINAVPPLKRRFLARFAEN
jgi:2-polyprenyl-6-methoxyphenol hydroxylase-like FAD-dependent oxidoreductase